MNKELEARQDREVTRAVRRLFWEANFQAKGWLILAYAMRIPAVAAYNVFIPLVSAYAIQSMVARDFAAVTNYAWLVLALSLVYVILWTIGGISVSKNAIIGSEYIQRKVFSNFLQKDYDFYGNTFLGSLGAQAARLRDAYNNYGELVTLSAPKQLTIVLAGVGVIAWQSPLLAVVTISAMFLVLSFTLWSSTVRVRYRRRVNEASSVMNGDIADALTQGTTVKSFAMEGFEEERLNISLQAWSRAQYRAWISSLPADAGRMTLAAIVTAILLVLSAHLYRQGTISVTIVVLIQLYVVKLVASTLDIAEIVKRYEDAMGAAYQPLKTMAVQNAVTDPEHGKQVALGKPITLRLQDVQYGYHQTLKDKLAIDHFSLTIAPGEKVGVVGYSGSGKTTLTKLLLRFMDVTHGSISLNDVDIRDMKQADLRGLLSYVPQEPLLFHRSIADNIVYAKPTATKEELRHVAKLAYVDEFVADLPEGYRTLVGERGVKLSGGQRQRVAIARALLKDSPILVLDEATSALDSRSEKLIQEALWELMKHRTALVIAHRLSTIQRMDRIVVMDKGKIVQLGTHQELLKDKTGIYAELWAHQSGGYVGVPDPEPAA